MSRSGERTKLLVVEDDLLTLEMMRLTLEDEGFAVLTADSAQAAHEAVKNERVDLVITDLKLTDGSGISLMKDLNHEKGLRGIAITGYDSVELGPEFVSHIVKPVDFNKLLSAINTACPV